MKNAELLAQQVEEWEALATRELPNSRAGWKRGNRTTAELPTVSQHLIPMQQEVFRLREALDASAKTYKKILKDKDVKDAIDKINGF